MVRWYNLTVAVLVIAAVLVGLPRSVFAGEANSETISLVIDALKGSDPQMQSSAIAILKEIPGEQITTALAKELPNLPPAGQVQLLSALAERGDRAALSAVIAAASSNDVSVRIAALRGVGRLGDVAAVSLLTAVAARTTGEEQKAAREGLYRLRGPEIDQAILKDMDSAEPRVKIELIRGIGERNISRGVESLLRAAKDSDSKVRAEALRAMRIVAGPESLPALVGLLLGLSGESDRIEAEKTIAAVAHKMPTGGNQAAAVLAVLPSVNDADKRASLIRALGKIADNSALPSVQAALSSKDPPVQDAAVRTLADWPSAEPLDDLLRIAATSDNQTHRILALRGFVRLLGLPANRSAKDTIELYKKAMSLAPNADEKKRVLSGLAGVRSLEAMTIAAEYLNDIALRLEAELSVLKIAQGICGCYPQHTKTVLTKLASETKQDELRSQAQELMSRVDRFDDYVTAWQLSGPYTRDETEGSALFDVAFEPEKPGGGAAIWQIMPAAANPDKPWLMELDKALGGENRAAYLRTRISSDKDQKVKLELGSDDGIKVWLNGQLVHANNAVRPVEPGQDAVEISLKQGWNDLLLKVTQNEAEWAVCARIRNLDGSKQTVLKVQLQ